MSELFLLAEGATSAQNLSIFSPAAPAAESIRALFILVLAVTRRDLPDCRRSAALQHRSVPAKSAGGNGTSAGLRQHADRDRLDGRPHAHCLSAGLDLDSCGI